MKIKNISPAIVIAASLFLESCEKELDFKYKEINPILVIEGQLTQERGEVSLTYTTPMGEAMDLNKLTDAVVTITDMDTGEIETLSPDSEGLYVSDVGGIEGHEYRLDVTRGDDNYSAVCMMRSESELTDMQFSWIKMPYDYVAVLQVSFTDDPADRNNYYWVRLYRNDEPYMWSEISDMQASGGMVDKIFMTSRKDLEEEDDATMLEEGDRVRATVVPTSRGMYDYLVALSRGNSNGPVMFEGSFCLGYFLAAPISTMEIIFHPDEMQLD